MRMSYHPRLNNPQEGSLIKMPTSNGDVQGRGEHLTGWEPDDVVVVWCEVCTVVVSQVRWMSQLRQLMMTVGAQRFISKALTYIMKLRQHNITSARRERESASVYAAVGTRLATALCYHCPELLSYSLITDYTA